MNIDLRFLPKEEQEKWKPIVNKKKDWREDLIDVANQHLRDLEDLKNNVKTLSVKQMAEEMIPKWEEIKNDLENEEDAE